jgi:hypothetical protein
VWRVHVGKLVDMLDVRWRCEQGMLEQRRTSLAIATLDISQSSEQQRKQNARALQDELPTVSCASNQQSYIIKESL